MGEVERSTRKGPTASPGKGQVSGRNPSFPSLRFARRSWCNGRLQSKTTFWPGALGTTPAPLQMQLEPGLAPAEAAGLDEMLGAMLDREAQITLAIEPLHPPRRGRS